MRSQEDKGDKVDLGDKVEKMPLCPPAHLLTCSPAPKSPPSPRPVAIDLFAGAGGFSLGIEQAGFDVLVAVEYDPIHAAVYAFNFPLTKVLCVDVTTLSAEAIKEAAARAYKYHYPQAAQDWNGQIDLVFGGPPCQGFSIKGKRRINDERNSLILEFYRLVTELSPRYFVMENVPGMAMGKHQIWLQQLENLFTQAGYKVQTQVLNAADFGVPQQRRRLFFIGSQADIHSVGLPKKLGLKRVTVGEAIADLPDLDEFSELLRTDEVLLSKSQLQQMQQLASSYAQILRGELSEVENFSYPRLWNSGLLTSSMRTQHNEDSINRFTATLPNQRELTSHLRRLDNNGLCHTLRAGTGKERGSYTSPRPIHPTQPRVISVREAARLHSFPDWFRLHQTKWHGFRQVGNAVPPLLGRGIGSQIIATLDIVPKLSVSPLKLGDPYLLRLNRSEAIHYWKSFDF